MLLPPLLFSVGEEIIDFDRPKDAYYFRVIQGVLELSKFKKCGRVSLTQGSHEYRRLKISCYQERCDVLRVDDVKIFTSSIFTRKTTRKMYLHILEYSTEMSILYQWYST